MDYKKMFFLNDEQLIQNAPQSYGTGNGLQTIPQLDAVNRNICAGTQILVQSLGTVEQAVRGVTRKQRRSMISDYMTIQPDGIVMLVSNYDDETQLCEPLIINSVGDWKILRLKFSQIFGKPEYFVINFQMRDTWIVGRMDKNTGSGLYDYFIRAGIRFNPQIQKSRIQRVLYEGLVKQIEDCPNTLIVPALAGWHEGKYRDAESYENLQKGDYPQLPIFEKKLLRSYGNDGRYQEYFSAIRSVRDLKARTCVMILPFAGILASIFRQENFRIPVDFNFVWYADMNVEMLGAFFKIFNREELAPVMLECSAKKVASILQGTNDDVLFVNALTRSTDTTYRKQKVNGDMQDIMDLSMGKCSAYHGYECQGTWVLAMLSTEFKCDNHSVNIFVENDFFSSVEKALIIRKEETLPEVLTAFISYIEDNWSIVRGFIRKDRSDLQPVERFFSIMLEMLEVFWDTQGIDMRKSMDLPTHIETGEWVTEDIFIEDEWRRIFVEVVRHEIGGFEVCNRNSEYSEKLFTIYYNQQYFWFPTKVLNRMLGKNGLLQKKNLFLTKLREMGVLVTDEVGLTRRLQVAGARREYYQLRREFFNELGKIDIVDLTRGVRNDFG